jgi:hypothetical protein
VSTPWAEMQLIPFKAFQPVSIVKFGLPVLRHQHS